MRDDDDQTISDIIFKRSREDQLQFETIFGGLLFSLVTISAPSGIQGGLIILSGVSLLVLSTLRWQTHRGRFSNGDTFLQKTIRPVEICAIICVIQIATVIVGLLPELPFLSLIETTAILTAISYIAYVGLGEAIFGTYRLGWGTLFYLRWREAHEFMGGATSIEEYRADLVDRVSNFRDMFYVLALSFIKRMYLETAYFVLDGAIPDERDEYLDELHQFVTAAREIKYGSVNLGVTGTMGLSGVVVLSVFLVLSFVIASVVNVFSGIGVGALDVFLVLGITRISKHIVAFSYIWFGTLDFEDYITTNGRSIGLILSYTAVVYLLFFFQ